MYSIIIFILAVDTITLTCHHFSLLGPPIYRLTSVTDYNAALIGYPPELANPSSAGAVFRSPRGITHSQLSAAMPIPRSRAFGNLALDIVQVFPQALYIT